MAMGEMVHTSAAVAVSGEADVTVARIRSLQVEAGCVLVASVSLGAIVHAY